MGGGRVEGMGGEGGMEGRRECWREGRGGESGEGKKGRIEGFWRGGECHRYKGVLTNLDLVILEKIKVKIVKFERSQKVI